MEQKKWTGGSKLEIAPSGLTAIKAWVYDACVGADWLGQLYSDGVHMKDYRKWIRKEQTDMGWEDIFMHEGS